jgi:hypothetical protein
MTKLGKLPREGTKDRAKLEAMRRIGPPHGATQLELQKIDGLGWGTYKNDGARYAEILDGELKIWGSGPDRRYFIKCGILTTPVRSRSDTGTKGRSP